jgi:hypothetical protein
MKFISIVTIIITLLMLIECSHSKNPTGPSYKEEKGKTANGYFFITSPEANCRVNLDSLLTIHWIASNKVVDSSEVCITLLRDSAYLKTITPSTSNNGTFKYILSRLGSGTTYQVKISTSDTTQFDISGFFELYSNYSGTLSMSYPSTGSILMLESSDTLRWNYTGFPGPRVRLDLYCDTTFLFTIVESMAASLKKYPWSSVTSPRGTNTHYRIKVTSESDESICNYGDYFTIKSIYTGGYSFKDPLATTVWTSGGNGAILWDTTGSPGPSVLIKLFKHDTLFGSIASNVSNTGRYDWKILKGMTTGSDYQIKIVSSNDAGLFTVSNYFTITGIDIDKFEPDNKHTSSHEIAIDSIETHSLTLRDTDWVQFTADSGSQYLILSKVSETLKIQWKLYSGSEMSAIDSGVSPPDGRMCFFWNCKKSGKYHAEIVPGDSVAAGGYTFGIYKFDPSRIAVFTSPLSTSEVSAGTKATVTWIPDTLIFGASIRLYLYKGSEIIAPLSSILLPNSGSFEWSIPNGIESGSDYRLYLVKESDLRIYGKGPVFSISGIPPDPFENDNKRSTASRLSLGEVQAHSISWNDTDWVRISAKSGTRYIFLMQCPDSFSTSISLFRDSSVQSLLTGVTDSTGHYSTAWNCQSGADYCIRIVASARETFGKYNLRVITFDSLNSIKFTSPSSSLALLRGTQTTISWLADSVITGDTVSISLYRGNSLQVVLASRLPSGTTSYAWSIADSLPPANNYQIRITNVANPFLYGYSSKFIISDIIPDVNEFDGTSAGASHAILDSIQNHNIIFNDTDFIKFTADSAIQYVFYVNGVNQFRISGSLYLEQTSTVSHTISSNSNGQSASIWSCPKSGVYYCRITGLSTTTTGSYSFKVSKFDPERIITFVTPAAGTSWSVDSTCILRWNSEGNSFGGTISISLYRESESLLQIARSVVNSDNFTWKIPIQLSSGTDYRIKLVNTSNPLFYAISPRFTINGLPQDQYEPDNSWSQAHQYTFGITELHNITWNDTDYIKFPVDSGAMYQIRLKGTNSFRTDMTIHYENSWNETAASASSFPDEIKELWYSYKSTTAYLKMFSGRSSVYPTGAYSILISKFDSLKSITFISPTAQTIVNEGSSFDVEWIPDSGFLGGAVFVQLFKADVGVLNSSLQSNSGKVTMSIPKNLFITGNDYRIRITDVIKSSYYGYSPFFTITGINTVADAYENDNSSDAAKSIAFGESQQHNLFNNDKDWIVFPITAGERYVFKGDAQMNINLKVHQGSPSSSNEEFSLSGKFCKQITSKTTGSCYIDVTSLVSPLNYQTYTLSVVHLDSSGVLKITSPTEGSVLTSGQDNILAWTCDTAVYGSNFTATIYKDNTVCTKMPYINAGNHTWNAGGAVSSSTYRIKIECNLDSSLYAYSPIFTIKGSDVDMYEVDNTPDKASEIALGAIQQHNFTLGDTDWVKIHASSGFDYIFQCIKDRGTRINFNLFDSANIVHQYSYILSESGYSSHDTTVFSWFCKTSGTYYLKCSTMEIAASINYALKINQSDTTQTIEFSEPVQGAVWTAGSPHTVRWTSKEEYFGAQVKINLLKGSQTITSVSFIPNTGLYSFPIPSSCENGSDYRISISIQEANVKKIFYSPLFTITGGIVPDQYEPDNSRDKASVISLDEMRHHTLHSNDTDYIQFQAVEGTTYIITDSTTCSELRSNLFYEIQEAPLFIYTFPIGQSTHEWTCTKSGTYYKRVTFTDTTDNRKTPGRYSIRISKK